MTQDTRAKQQDYRVELNPLTNSWFGYFLNRPGWPVYCYPTGESARRRMDEIAALGEKGEYQVWHDTSQKYLWRRSDNMLAPEGPTGLAPKGAAKAPAPPSDILVTFELSAHDFLWFLYKCGKADAPLTAEALVKSARFIFPEAKP
mgnify:CR=1 FL=1